MLWLREMMQLYVSKMESPDPAVMLSPEAKERIRHSLRHNPER
jgi:hypothetical protein